LLAQEDQFELLERVCVGAHRLCHDGRLWSDRVCCGG
jgi:hypothetical protein